MFCVLSTIIVRPSWFVAVCDLRRPQQHLGQFLHDCDRASITCLSWLALFHLSSSTPFGTTTTKSFKSSSPISLRDYYFFSSCLICKVTSIVPDPPSSKLLRREELLELMAPSPREVFWAYQAREAFVYSLPEMGKTVCIQCLLSIIDNHSGDKGFLISSKNCSSTIRNVSQK
jgi:hypothetical protein